VNEEFARQFLPNTNPIGGHFGVGGNPGRQSDLEIIGVVENAKYDDPREKTQAMAYLPLSQVRPVEVAERRNNLVNVIEVRSIGDPMSMAGEVRQVMTEIAPELPLLQVTTLADDVRDMTKTDIVIADLAGFFGGLALLLTCIGLYGLTAWTVQRRTSEIGVRAALGANRRTVISMVMREALAQAVPGILIGIPATLAATRLIASQLYGVNPFDPRSILAAVFVLLLCIAVAGYLPARQASRIDPAVALRYE
jgi:ABC-type antimicrobial peptide transport system permease subunit